MSPANLGPDGDAPDAWPEPQVHPAFSPPPLPPGHPLNFAPPQAALPAWSPPAGASAGRGRMIALVAVVLGVVLLVGGGVSLVTYKIIRARRLPARDDSVSSKYQEASGAFAGKGNGGGSQAVSAQDKAAIDALLVKLGSALARGDQKTIGDCYDFDRMVTELQRQPGALSFGRNERAQFTQGLKKGFVQSVASSGLAGWNRQKVIQVRMLDSGDPEAVVYLRSWNTRGIPSKVRFWVRKSGGSGARGATWQVYDEEDLDAGIRTSTMMSALAAQGAAAGASSNVLQSIHALQTAAVHMSRHDLAQAEIFLKKVPTFPALPSEIEGLRWMLWTSLQVQRGQYAQALDSAEQATHAHRDMPVIELLRARALNALHRHREALDAIDRYEQALAPDASSCWHKGDALRGEQRLVDAAKVYRSGLDDDPDTLDNLDGLAASLPAGDKSEIGQRLMATANHRHSFFALAGAAVKRRDPDTIAAMLAVYQPEPSTDPWPGYYAGEEQSLRGNYNQAVVLLGQARPYMKGDNQKLVDDEMRFAQKRAAAIPNAPRTAPSIGRPLTRPASDVAPRRAPPQRAAAPIVRTPATTQPR